MSLNHPLAANSKGSRRTMRKLQYVFMALAALCFAVPAFAQTAVRRRQPGADRRRHRHGHGRWSLRSRSGQGDRLRPPKHWPATPARAPASSCSWCSAWRSSSRSPCSPWSSSSPRSSRSQGNRFSPKESGPIFDGRDRFGVLQVREGPDVVAEICSVGLGGY